MAQLIQTSGSKPTDVHTVVPTKNNSVFITGANGRISGEDALPVPVQKNIDIENVRISDSVVNNSSETKHGLLPKLSGDATEVLNGLGTWVNMPKVGTGFGNIWWVKTGTVVTVGETYENVVTNMLVDGTLIVDGILTIL